jgi:glycerol-3-phosphate dehydrogenase
MSLLLDKLDCDPATAHGPAGRGDMWVCTTPHSRNFRYGAGDESLRDQAEGYNAMQHCRVILDAEKYPLIEKIYNNCSK